MSVVTIRFEGEDDPLVSLFANDFDHFFLSHKGMAPVTPEGQSGTFVIGYDADWQADDLRWGQHPGSSGFRDIAPREEDEDGVKRDEASFSTVRIHIESDDASALRDFSYGISAFYLESRNLDWEALPDAPNVFVVRFDKRTK